jgi:hypothetical protein
LCALPPLTSPSIRSYAPKAPVVKSLRALTIAEAKPGLAKTFGVGPEAIEITIHG